MRKVFFVSLFLLNGWIALSRQGELVNWSDGAENLKDVRHYIVERNGFPIAISPSSSFRFIDWNGNQIDIYRVRAVFTTAAPSRYVSSHDYTLVVGNAIRLEWEDNSNNETGFEIQQKVNDGPYAYLATVSANVSEFTVIGVRESIKYAYRVRAFNSDGNSPFSNELSTFVLLKKPVNAILNLN